MRHIILLQEGIRIFLRRIKVGFKGIKRYDGNVEKILTKVIEDCWNKDKEYFMVSPGHFREFYTRDFGWCCKALIGLGHKERVRKTLLYAMDRFKEKGSITTSINPGGKAFDFPTVASDSVPFFIRCLRILDDKDIIIENKEFLQRVVNEYFEKIFDKDEGLVKKELWLSSMKDHAIRNSSTYDNSMCMMIKDDIEELEKYGIENPFKEFDIQKNISKFLFNGKYFYNDMNKEKEVYGDANIFPFYCGMLKAKIALKSCINEIVKKGLDKPFPLKYQAVKQTKEKKIWQEFFVQGYEKDTIWWHMMPIFLRVVKELDKGVFEMYLENVKKIIEKEKNYLEVFNSQGEPLKSKFYYCDEGMIWASMLLALMKEKEII